MSTVLELDRVSTSPKAPRPQPSTAPTTSDLALESFSPLPCPRSDDPNSHSGRFGWWGNFRGVQTGESESGIVEKRRPQKTQDVLVNAPLLGESGPFRQPPAGPIECKRRDQRLNDVTDSMLVRKINHGTVLYECNIPIANLPESLNGYTILHYSDVHFQPRNLRRLTNIRALGHYLKSSGIRIDAVVGTGDFITDSKNDLNKLSLRVLDRLAPEALRIAVLGNHDFYGDSANYVSAALRSIGYHILGTKHSRLCLPDIGLNFFGIDDYLEGAPLIPNEALEHAPEVNILLTHSLDAVRAGCPDVFDLVLSGHLHAGEVFGGMQIMKRFGYTEDINRQLVGWDMLTDRAASFISPGHSQHWFRVGVAKPGAALIRLVPLDTEGSKTLDNRKT